MPFKPGNPGKPKGAKTKSTLDIKALIDSSVDWPTIFSKLGEKANDGDEKCAKLLLEYRFGKPISVEIGGTNEPIKHEHSITGIDSQSLKNIADVIARAREGSSEA